MALKPPLDDPNNAAHAWARYRMLMRWMALATLATMLVALYLLYLSNGLVSVHLYIATGLGIGATMMLSAALMGLAFLSNGTGHDYTIDDRLEDGWHY